MNNIFKIDDYIFQENIAIIGGCFDVLHPGHIEYLRLSKALGYKILIALEPDEFIIKNKKRYPVHSQNERAKILSSIKYVDCIVEISSIYNFDNYLKLCDIIKPSAILCRENDPRYENKKLIADKIACSIIKIDNINIDKSTSKIIKNIQNNSVVKSSYSGKIVKGLGFARTLNCPTLNIKINEEIDSIEGVYLSKNILNGQEYLGISYFDNKRSNIIESHIFNYVDSNYQFAEVNLMRFLRSKMNFNDTDSLINQIKLDILLARSMLFEN